MGTWFDACDRFGDPAGARRVGLYLEILGRFEPGKVADLGAGHGIFARAAADLGWEVTAFDARADRFPEDSRVKWVVQDIRAVDLSAFDLVLCLGLWYHLTLDDQRLLLRRCAPATLVIDTHFAVEDRAIHGRQAGKLSEIEEIDGLCGRWYDESAVQDKPTASFGNLRSFWPTEATLTSQLAAAGYDLVETYTPAVGPDRRFFVARALGSTARQQLDVGVGRYVTFRNRTPPAWTDSGSD